jgi:large subunit ribosomal protein L5
MHFLKHFYSKTLSYDLINKFFYNNTKKLPRLKKIILNFGGKTTEIKHLAASLLALELITNQKGALTTAKRPNIRLKIRKGNPTGCKVTLRRNYMFDFFFKTLADVFPKIKNFKEIHLTRKMKENIFSYEVHDTFSFPELEEHYYLFNNLPKLHITIVTSCDTKKEFLFLLKSFQFPFNKS